MPFRSLVGGVVVLAFALVSPAAGQPADPWIGTWKINLAKSKYNYGVPPKSSTVTVVAADGGFKQIVETLPGGLLAMATRSEVVARFDGKDTRVTGNRNADTSAYRKIDARSYEVVSKKDGKVTLTSIVTISADGRTRTVTQTGTDAQGQKVNNTIVYDRK